MALWKMSIGVFAALLIGAAVPSTCERIVDYKCSHSTVDKPTLTKAFYSCAILVSCLLSAFGFFISFRVVGQTLISGELISTILLAIAFSYIDFRIRIIPNELVLLFLSISVVFRFLEWNVPSLTGHFAGLLLTTLLFSLSALLAGKGSVGMGDIKLAMVIGFAAGFPYALVAILAMALSMGLFSIIGMLLKKLNAKSKLPFAAFLMFGAIVAKLLVLNS